MTFSLNLLIIVAILSIIIFAILMKMMQAKKETTTQILSKDINVEELKIPALIGFVNKQMIKITTSNLYEENHSEEEFNRRKRRRNELKQALKNCNTGDLSSKIYVREYINDLLKNGKKIDEKTINHVIPFNAPSKMTAREQFETVLYLVSKKEENKALGWLIEKYKLNEKKEDGSYRVTTADIKHIYEDLVDNKTLKIEDKLRIVTQLVYSHYKGFGIIDEIRDMQIDGVSGGVSGIPERLALAKKESDLEGHIELSTSLNSAWVMYRGKSIHFSFLTFEHESELRRVTTNVYKYGYPGQLSETKPAIINEMADGSRVTVIRPKLTESWAFFIRKKYDAEKIDVEELIQQPNSGLVVGLLKFLVKGGRTLALTGSQGSGKTTLLMALIEHIEKGLHLRVQETKFELNLRNQYPLRNILSFQETDTYSGQDALDLQKKTDGDVTILGEVATDPVAAWMIQTAQVASKFTLFTHHAKTFSDLVFALRNSLLKTGMFHNERIAEQQVVSVLEFDIHLRYNKRTGERSIERVTECIPIRYNNESVAISALNDATDRDAKIDVLLATASAFFHQQTQTQQFIENTVLEFKDGQYVGVNRISDGRIEEIMEELSLEDQKAFKEFIEKYWG